MTLKELKTALQRFPPDLDDVHVMIQLTQENHEKIYDMVCAVGFVEKIPCVIIGNWQTIEENLDQKSTLELFQEKYPHIEVLFDNQKKILGYKCLECGAVSKSALEHREGCGFKDSV